MSKNMKLEDSKLWQLTSEVIEHIYGLLDNFPEEEKWGMQSKLRARAFDASSDIAEATGSIDPRDIKWQLGMARRSLFGLKNALRLAHKAGYLEAQPELMVKIDKATELVDLGITQATQNIPLWFKEMDPPIKDNKK